MMKKVLLMICCGAALSNIAFAQDDSKYLAGAVPVIDGKVTFNSTINAPTLTKEELFRVMKNWATDYFKPQAADKEKLIPRILLSNEADGSIAAYGEEYMIFNSSFLSLDRTRINYHFFITCSNGRCELSMTHIHYLYDEERDGGIKYDADTWIDDKTALNKKKTKLAPLCGKFRRKTIDLKEELFKSAQNAIGTYLISLDQQKNPQMHTAKTPTAPAVTLTQNAGNDLREQVDGETSNAAITTSEAAKESSATENRIKTASHITVVANDEEFTLGNDAWGGLGEMFGKKVAFILIDTQKTMANMMLVRNETYEIRFYQEDGHHEPSSIIKCKKFMQQTMEGAEATKINGNANPRSAYNMYVGEIIE